MIKREIKRVQYKIGKYAEPALVVVLMAIFVIPVISVINMTPHVKKTDGQVSDKNGGVLGVVVDSQVSISPVGGSHNYIKDEKLNLINENLYTFSVKVLSRSSGTYSKPILRVSNGTDQDAKYIFALKSDEASNTRVGILNENTNYVLRSIDGIYYTPQVTIPKGEYADLYLQIHNENDINYDEELVIKLVQAR